MSNDHFAIVDEAISPQPWMQYRQVATNSAPSVSKSYAVTGGGNKNDPVHTIDAKWTNNTPVTQWVYGMVTRGGALVALQARSRGFLVQTHGVDVGTSVPSSYDMIEASRFGIGGDYGVAGILGIGTGFAVSEIRQHSQTIPFMPHQVGWWSVDPGETFYARVELRFATLFWENTSIDGNDTGSESRFISGETRLDLFATPAAAALPARSTPTIVGSAEHSINYTFETDVDKPTGTTTGDVLIAVVANQFGVVGDLDPGESGWTEIHRRDAGWENVHARVFWKVAGGSEPSSYTFGNSLLAESIVTLVAIRNASPSLEDGWHIASNLGSKWWERDGGLRAPSIDRSGQMLLCFSYVPFAAWQTPVNQATPTGMTELSDASGNLSTMSCARLTGPPRPTVERLFVPSKDPVWAKKSVAVTILVPGKQS